tara:strand:+ start:560 stop:805 length:246 start_codon:yes stop_codon:yes gene_type:complete
MTENKTAREERDRLVALIDEHMEGEDNETAVDIARFLHREIIRSEEMRMGAELIERTNTQKLDHARYVLRQFGELMKGFLK